MIYLDSCNTDAVATLIVQNVQYDMDERLLAHLKIVISQKLRRSESFMLTWSRPSTAGSGQFAVWLSHSMSLHFRFAGSRPASLNQQWIHDLMQASFRVQGLNLDDVAEPGEGTAGGGRGGSKGRPPAVENSLPA